MDKTDSVSNATSTAVENCVFCKIIAGEIPARIAFQDDEVFAFHDIEPQAPIHVVIVPRIHLASIDEFGMEHAGLLAHLIVAAQIIAGPIGARENGYRLVVNHGSDGGQSVAHTHVHLLAGRALGWPPG